MTDDASPAHSQNAQHIHENHKRMRTPTNEPKHLGLNSLSVFILPKPRTQ